MASIQANGSKGHHKFILEVNQASQNVTNNTSTVSFTFKIAPIETSWAWEQWGDNIKYTVTINGTAYTGSIANYDGYATVTLKSGSQTITHNADGTKSISYSFSVTDTSGQSYTCGNASASGTLQLSTIARYGTSNQSLNSKTETSIIMNWSSSATIDYIWYSTDWGTTWKAVGSVNAKSGSYTINQPSNSTNALSANTTYNIITRVRSKDSQLTTNSSKLSVTTYDFPYCTKMPNFTIGNSVTLEFYNPLNRTFTMYLLGNDGSTILEVAMSGTNRPSAGGEVSVANLYKSIPNAKSGTYKVKVVYGSSTITKTGGTYSIKGTETPTVGTITYADTNATVTAITGNNQHIVQNQSNLKVTYTSATGKNSATIKSYSFTLNGVTKTSTTAGGTIDFGKINSGSNITLTMKVTDSRGLTASASKVITILPHSAPTAVVTLNRLNNYEDETYLTVDGTIASVNSKNKMTIQYRYAKAGGSYNTFTTISDNTKQTLSLPKSNIYNFNVVITDSFGSKFDKYFVLNKGVFPLFIDTVKNSVGINHLPINNDSLEIDGPIYASNVKCKNLLYTPYTEKNKLTDTATKDDYTVKTNHYCYLEAGKTYTFSCKTSATWGGSTSTDTVEVFLLKDNNYDLYISINANPKTFTVTETGYYFVRYDINKNGVTHSFWDMQIEEGTVATDFVEGKEFSNKQSYRLSEQQVGNWINGKPLYKKTVSISKTDFGTTEMSGTAGTGKNVDIAHNIKNIKDVIKFEEIWNRNGQYRKFPSNYYGNAGWDSHYYCTTEKICFELGYLIYNRLIADTISFYVTIYYTKTTD